jgi:hypothetical protein
MKCAKAEVFFVVMILLIGLLLTVSSCKEESIEPVGTFEQVSPPAGRGEISTTPTFEWNQATAVESYRLEVSTKSDFSSLAFEVSGLKENTFTLTSPLLDGYQYYWRIKATNKKGDQLAANAGISFRTMAKPVTASPAISKYFISPTGEDNPDKGTRENPFKTLAYAATRVPADEGDTLFLQPGTFIESAPAVIPTGVNVVGSGETQTILSSTGVTLAPGINAASADFKFWYDGSLIQLVSPHRTVFRNNNTPALEPANGNQALSGFTIDGNNKSLKAGVWIENRNNITMHHVTFKNLSQRGAVFAPGNKNFYVYPTYYLTGIKIHDCTFTNSGKDLPDETLGNLCLAQLDGADIYNISVTDNEGYGIKFIFDGYFKNTKIHDCNITLSESDAKWGEDIAIELWNVGPGNEIYNINCNTWLSIVNHPNMFGSPAGTENMKVYNVKMIDIDGASSKEAVEVGAPGVEVYDSYFENKGFGMAIWDMGRENITIRNNIFYNSTQKDNWASGAAIYIDNSRTWQFKNINVFNNVFDTHKVAVKLKNTGAGILDIQVRNNAFLNSGTSELEAVGTNISFTNNLKYKEGSVIWNAVGATTVSNNILGMPLFKNTGNRWDSYYKPASSTSFVIDKGYNVGLPFNGAAPDIGRYEY